MLRAYTAKFADLLATHARRPLKVAWFNLGLGHFSNSKDWFIVEYVV